MFLENFFFICFEFLGYFIVFLAIKTRVLCARNIRAQYKNARVQDS